jgi:ubiquitin C-terminal hydrolase
VTEKIWKFVHGLYGGGPTIAKDSAFPVMPIATKKISLAPAGIENPLNLCFMISILQMLMSNEHLNGYMLKK